jgi:hypothetical protein
MSLAPTLRPVCRRAGCPNPSAAATFGYCFDCGLTYIRWRVQRDELERLDLAAAGYGPGEPVDPDDEASLDLMHRLLTPLPFHTK